MYVEVDGEQGSLTWLKARLRLDVTGADAAASVGCSQYEGAENLRRSKQFEREKSDDQLLKESPSFNENVHTRAGHANEDPIAKASARLLFPQETIVVLYQPRLAVPRDLRWSWFGASADRFVFCENKLCAILECKFSFGGVLEHPMVEHVFQTMMQMRTIQTRYNYLCYGTYLFFLHFLLLVFSLCVSTVLNVAFFYRFSLPLRRSVAIGLDAQLSRTA
jgi:hypothetical protein